MLDHARATPDLMNRDIHDRFVSRIGSMVFTTAGPTKAQDKERP